ncbi:MAG: AAA family ATPase [Patescibacteria group bacterium]
MPKNSLLAELKSLNQKVDACALPKDLKERVLQMLDRLNRISQTNTYSSEFDVIENYINWITEIPWDKKTKDNLDLKNAKGVLDKNHYGLEQVKERVLEYLAVENLKIINKDKVASYEKAPVLCLVGLQGLGKTTLASSIAEALGRKFVRISLGALGSILELRGKSKSLPAAEPGQIIKALVRTKVGNPLILLDEMDKVSGEQGLRSDMMAALLEILDPEQNTSFVDHYVDYPIDLSNVLFISSANNIGTFSAALMDRLEIIRMPSYSDKEKEIIARDYLLSKIMRTSGILPEQLKIKEEVWPKLIRPLGYDSGIRSLQRILESVCRKSAKIIIEQGERVVVVDETNFKSFLPIL